MAVQSAYNISAEWLLHGRGEMVLDKAAAEQLSTFSAQPQKTTHPSDKGSIGFKVLQEVQAGRTEIRRVGEDVRISHRDTSMRLTVMDVRVSDVEKKLGETTKIGQTTAARVTLLEQAQLKSGK